MNSEYRYVQSVMLLKHDCNKKSASKTYHKLQINLSLVALTLFFFEAGWLSKFFYSCFLNETLVNMFRETIHLTFRKINNIVWEAIPNTYKHL